MDLLVSFAVLVIVVIVVYWLLKQMPLPEPAGQIINVLIVVIVAVVAIGLLLRFAGHGTYIGFP